MRRALERLFADRPESPTEVSEQPRQVPLRGVRSKRTRGSPKPHTPSIGRSPDRPRTPLGTHCRGRPGGCSMGFRGGSCRPPPEGWARLARAWWRRFPDRSDRRVTEARLGPGARLLATRARACGGGFEEHCDGRLGACGGRISRASARLRRRRPRERQRARSRSGLASPRRRPRPARRSTRASRCARRKALIGSGKPHLPPVPAPRGAVRRAPSGRKEPSNGAKGPVSGMFDR
jgi:hypothetical protein